MSLIPQSLSPQKFVERLQAAGGFEIPYLWGKTEKASQVGDPFGDEAQQYVGAAKDAPGPFRKALDTAISYTPFGLTSILGRAVAKETERVGEASSEFLKESASAVAGAASGFKTGTQIAGVVLVLLVGLWALGTARRVVG